MISIQTNTSAMQALQALNANSKSLAETQNRISTGLKVASAKDDGATYGVAQEMRAKVASMDVVNESLNRGSSILDVTASAAQSVSDLLAEMKQKALTYSDASLDTTDRGEVRQELRDLISQISIAVDSATFGGVNLLSGDYEATITHTYGPAVLPSLSTSQTFDGLAGVIDVSFDSEEVQSYSAIVSGGQQPSPMGYVNIASAASIATGGEIPYGPWGSYQPPVPSTVSFNYSSSPLGSATTSGITDLSITEKDFDGGAVITSTDGATQILGPKPMTTHWLGLDLVDAPHLYDGSGNELGANTLSPMFLTAIDSALSTVQKYVGEIGSEQNMLDNMKTQNSNLTDALNTGIGNLVDADMASESANLQAEQVKQTLGTQSLSIANQQPNWILKLFK